MSSSISLSTAQQLKANNLGITNIQSCDCKDNSCGFPSLSMSHESNIHYSTKLAKRDNPNAQALIIRCCLDHLFGRVESLSKDFKPVQ